MYKISTVVNMQGRQQVEQIMQDIYKENPANWPYGISIRGHDDVYLIREKEAGVPVGFVGWQTQYEGAPREKVGYYSIGILPAYRKQGFAKEAVQKIIHIKSAGYDRIRAFIVPGNTPSIELANRLGIPIVHECGTKVAGVGSSGCLMAMFPELDARRILNWTQEQIAPRFLANDGLEREVHITVLYGFEDTVGEQDLRDFLVDIGPLDLKLGKIKRFEADENRPDSDVLVVSVDSAPLQQLHARLKEQYAVTTTYPDYNPHLTLAYVRPGVLRQRLDNHSRFSGELYSLNTLVFSTAGSRRKFTIDLKAAGEVPAVARA